MKARLGHCKHILSKHCNKSNSNLKLFYVTKYYRGAYTTPHKRRRREKEYAEKWGAHMARLKQQTASDDIGENIFISHKYALSLEECIYRVISLSHIQYDETIEIECQMNLDPRKGNEYIRGNIILPHGTGRVNKICVFIPPTMHDEVLDIDKNIIIGTDELLQSIGNGSILDPLTKQYPFDIIISTPDQLRKIVPFGRQLGPKGLMPNAKLGTLTNDPISAIKSAQKGQVSIRMIDGGKNKGIIQGPIGKVSFGGNKIEENILSFLKQLRDDLRPPAAKKQYFLKCILSSSQGRSYQILVNDQEPWIKKEIKMYWD